MTSALDSIVGQNVIKLLERLRAETGVSFVFISHDLSTVSSFADQIVVLYAGRVVEERPRRPGAGTALSPIYAAADLVGPGTARRLAGRHHADPREALAGISRGVKLTATGCPFFDRCPVAIQGTCDTQVPPNREDVNGHRHVIACHHELGELSFV